MTPLFPPSHYLAEMDTMSVENAPPHFGEKLNRFIFTQIKPELGRDTKLLCYCVEFQIGIKGAYPCQVTAGAGCVG